MAIYIPSYKQAAEFRPGDFNPITLAENERVKVIEACFELGQFIPVHRPGVDMTVVVLEGRGSMMAGEREEAIEAGTIAFVSAGEARGIKAETQLVLLHVVTPPPKESDHVQVAAGLQRGEWK